MTTFSLVELCRTINNVTGVVTYYRMSFSGKPLRISKGEYEQTYNQALEHSPLYTTNDNKYTRHYITCKLGS